MELQLRAGRAEETGKDFPVWYLGLRQNEVGREHLFFVYLVVKLPCILETR